MENQPNQSSKPANKTLWIVLVFVILAIVGYGVYAYVVNNTNENSNQNTNTAVNTNSNSNQAANTNSNTNATANANANTNTATNTNIDTSGWKTYTNSEYGYTMQYPSDWTVEEKMLAEDPLDYLPPPLRGVYFYSPERKYLLRVGIMKQGDEGAIILSSGIGGNVKEENDTITIMNVNVKVTKMSLDDKVIHIIIPVNGGATRGAILIKDYEFKSEFFQGPGMTMEEIQTSDIQGSMEEQIVYSILQSLHLT